MKVRGNAKEMRAAPIPEPLPWENDGTMNRNRLSRREVRAGDKSQGRWWGQFWI